MQLISLLNNNCKKIDKEVEEFIVEIDSMMNELTDAPSLGIVDKKEKLTEQPTTPAPKYKDVLIYKDKGEFHNFIITAVKDNFVIAANPTTFKKVKLKVDDLEVALRSKDPKVKQMATKLGTKYQSSRVWVYGSGAGGQTTGDLMIDILGSN